MCPRKRGLSKQEGRDAGCKGFGGTARHEFAEHALTLQGSLNELPSKSPTPIRLTISRTAAQSRNKVARAFQRVEDIGKLVSAFTRWKARATHSPLTQSPQLKAGTHNWASTGFDAPCASEK